MAFLQRFENDDKYRMSHSVEHIIAQWLARITAKNSKLGGHKICPFAKMPRVIAVKKLSASDFVNLDDEITVYMETDIVSSYQELEDLCKELKALNTNYVFLPDHPHKSNYINGEETGNKHLPCIIVQTKEELNSARASLEKTDYYSYWDQEYLKEIKGFD